MLVAQKNVPKLNICYTKCPMLNSALGLPLIHIPFYWLEFRNQPLVEFYFDENMHLQILMLRDSNHFIDILIFLLKNCNDLLLTFDCSVNVNFPKF